MSQAQNRWLIMSALFVLLVLVNIDYTALNVALVTISLEMDTSLNTIQWLLSGYVLAWAAMVIPAGRLADIFLKKSVLLTGVWLFILGSVMCGLAHTIEWIILGRIIQGIGGALFAPPVYTLTFSVFPAHRRGFAIGILGVACGLGLAIGPSFGGVMIQWLSWRWIFWLNVPLCLITVLITCLAVKEQKSELTTSQDKFDFIGSILLGTSMIVLMFGLNEIEHWGINDPNLWMILAAAIVLFGLFLFSQCKQTHRLIPAGLFANRSFVGCLSAYLIFSMGFSVILVAMGLYLQNPRHFSAYETGLIFLAMTIVLGLFSPFGGRLTDRLDPRIPICGGMLIFAIGIGLCACLNATSAIGLIIAALLFAGLGMGIALPSLNATMLRTVSEDIISTASGVFTMGSTIGNTLGVIFSTSFIVGIAIPKLNRLLAQVDFIPSPKEQAALTEYLSQAHPEIGLLESIKQMDTTTLIQYIEQAFVGSMAWLMGIMGLLIVLAVIIAGRTIKLKPVDIQTQ